LSALGYHLRIDGHGSRAPRRGRRPAEKETGHEHEDGHRCGSAACSALAQTARQQPRQQHSVNPSYDVYKNGQYLGSDPDPNIRALMQRGNGPAGQW